jgi:hypothetical protein
MIDTALAWSRIADRGSLNGNDGIDRLGHDPVDVPRKWRLLSYHSKGRKVAKMTHHDLLGTLRCP